MEVNELLRVVTLRKGKLKPVEFKLREGEKGLSLFAYRDQPGPAEVIEAVRAMGKQGNLATAVISAHEFRALGLTLVQTPGGTPFAAVNTIHYEARLPFLRRLFLRLRGVRGHDDFNEHLSPKLCAIARVLE
ncbi:hypothetical protein HYR99_23465 [Candidatus Poribacteria bacterium]|nr:hypothetical protein [Candidatus Poribacteria bacterium]